MAVDMMSTRRLAAFWHGLVADELKLPRLGRAVVLADVQPGSPAEAAGFKPGDHVIKVGELRVTTPLDIEARAARRGPRPTHLRADPPRRSGAGPGDSTSSPCRGRRLTPVKRSGECSACEPHQSTRGYVTTASNKLRGGLYVHAVSPGSAAEIARIQKGDILVGMNVGVRHWETIRPDNILFILRQPETAHAQTLQFYIVRQNGIHQGVLSLAEVPTLAATSR